MNAGNITYTIDINSKNAINNLKFLNTAITNLNIQLNAFSLRFINFKALSLFTAQSEITGLAVAMLGRQINTTTYALTAFDSKLLQTANSCNSIVKGEFRLIQESFKDMTKALERYLQLSNRTINNEALLTGTKAKAVKETHNLTKATNTNSKVLNQLISRYGLAAIEIKLVTSAIRNLAKANQESLDSMKKSWDDFWQTLGDSTVIRAIMDLIGASFKAAEGLITVLRDLGYLIGKNQERLDKLSVKKFIKEGLDGISLMDKKLRGLAGVYKEFEFKPDTYYTATKDMSYEDQVKLNKEIKIYKGLREDIDKILSESNYEKDKSAIIMLVKLKASAEDSLKSLNELRNGFGDTLKRMSSAELNSIKLGNPVKEKQSFEILPQGSKDYYSSDDKLLKARQKYIDEYIKLNKKFYKDDEELTKAANKRADEQFNYKVQTSTKALEQLKSLGPALRDEFGNILGSTLDQLSQSLADMADGTKSASAAWQDLGTTMLRASADLMKSLSSIMKELAATLLLGAAKAAVKGNWVLAGAYAAGALAAGAASLGLGTIAGLLSNKATKQDTSSEEGKKRINEAYEAAKREIELNESSKAEEKAKIAELDKWKEAALAGQATLSDMPTFTYGNYTPNYGPSTPTSTNAYGPTSSPIVLQGNIQVTQSARAIAMTSQEYAVYATPYTGAY